MTRDGPPSNLAASVRARLLNLARKRGIEFQLVLSEFAIERFLYRLAVSSHSELYALKGATLFRVWTDDRHRATWDLDLLGRGTGEIDDAIATIEQLCSMEVDDGIEFDVDGLTAERIRGGDTERGVRIRFEARLAEARIPMQVDIGFDESVTPLPQPGVFPSLLDQPRPEILLYSREAVVAEKLEAAISLGVTNSRMKDFYDLFVLATSFDFDGPSLTEAIRATFQKRGLRFPDSVPLVLTEEFLDAPQRAAAWRAFLRRGRLEAPPDITRLAAALREFLWPVLRAIAQGEHPPRRWSAGGPWEGPTG